MTDTLNCISPFSQQSPNPSPSPSSFSSNVSATGYAICVNRQPSVLRLIITWAPYCALVILVTWRLARQKIRCDFLTNQPNRLLSRAILVLTMFSLMSFWQLVMQSYYSPMDMNLLAQYTPLYRPISILFTAQLLMMAAFAIPLSKDFPKQYWGCCPCRIRPCNARFGKFLNSVGVLTLVVTLGITLSIYGFAVTIHLHTYEVREGIIIGVIVALVLIGAALAFLIVRTVYYVYNYVVGFDSEAYSFKRISTSGAIAFYIMVYVALPIFGTSVFNDSMYYNLFHYLAPKENLLPPNFSIPGELPLNPRWKPVGVDSLVTVAVPSVAPYPVYCKTPLPVFLIRNEIWFMTGLILYSLVLNGYNLVQGKHDTVSSSIADASYFVSLSFNVGLAASLMLGASFIADDYESHIGPHNGKWDYQTMIFLQTAGVLLLSFVVILPGGRSLRREIYGILSENGWNSRLNHDFPDWNPGKAAKSSDLNGNGGSIPRTSLSSLMSSDTSDTSTSSEISSFKLAEIVSIGEGHDGSEERFEFAERYNISDRLHLYSTLVSLVLLMVSGFYFALVGCTSSGFFNRFAIVVAFVAAFFCLVFLFVSLKIFPFVVSVIRAHSRKDDQSDIPEPPLWTMITGSYRWRKNSYPSLRTLRAWVNKDGIFHLEDYLDADKASNGEKDVERGYHPVDKSVLKLDKEDTPLLDEVTGRDDSKVKRVDIRSLLKDGLKNMNGMLKEDINALKWVSRLSYGSEMIAMYGFLILAVWGAWVRNDRLPKVENKLCFFLFPIPGHLSCPDPSAGEGPRD